MIIKWKLNIKKWGDCVKNKKASPQERYAKICKTVQIWLCSPHTEQDVIKKLESVPNKAGYIKKLIRADIAANSSNDWNYKIANRAYALLAISHIMSKIPLTKKL